MKRFMLSILILSILIGYASLAQADWTDYYKWESIIWQDDGTEKGKLKIGTSKDATNGYDPIYEKDAFFAGNLRSYFYHPEWGRSSIPGATDYYWDDIRSANLPQTWDFSVEGYRTDRNITLTWDISHLAGDACSSIELSMTDMVSGQTVVMTDGTNASYSYFNASSSAYPFRVTAKEVPIAIAAPANLRANQGSGEVVLHWSAEAAMAGYKVYRSASGGAFALVSGDSLVTDNNGDGIINFVDKTADKKSAPTTYTYAVTAINPTGCESSQATVEVIR